MTKPRCFNFDTRWSEVEPILTVPKVQRAISAAMTNWCRSLGKVWDPEKGPWFYSQPARNSPAKRGTPDWYRCYGACHLLSAWCGAMGEVLEPSLTWFTGHSLDGEHSAALGFADFEDEHPVLVMDILWHYELIDGVPAGTDEEAATGILRVLASNDHFAALPVDHAIARLEGRPGCAV